MNDIMQAGCEVRIDGNPGGPTMFFIHGWPDDARLWRKQVAALGDDYRCVRVTLPNFGPHQVRAGGFNFAQLVCALLATLDETAPHGKVTLVTHDWGTYLGYLIEQAAPERVERMVALDVGAHVAPSPREAGFIIGYQWTLVLLWLVGGVLPPLGNWLTRRFAGLLGVPPRQRVSIRSRCNYPYFYLWRGLLLPPWRKELLGRYRPQCPILFLWGEKKPVMFHSRRWLQTVEDSGGCSQGIAGAGHWLQESHADEVNGLIRAFLRRGCTGPE